MSSDVKTCESNDRSCLYGPTKIQIYKIINKLFWSCLYGPTNIQI